MTFPAWLYLLLAIFALALIGINILLAYIESQVAIDSYAWLAQSEEDERLLRTEERK